MRVGAAMLLLALPAAAEVPGGHVYFGAGALWMAPLSSGGPSWQPTKGSFGLSLELAYEARQWFVALGLAYAGFSNWQPELGFASLRAGWILGSGSVAPYLAAGVALAAESGQSTSDCVVGGCYSVSGSGPALIAEAGLLFFRDLRFGRVAVSAQLVAPLFPVRVLNSDVGSVPALLVALKIVG
jgi:hypothetical protein